MISQHGKRFPRPRRPSIRGQGQKPMKVNDVWKKEMAKNLPDGTKGVQRMMRGRRLRRATRISSRRKFRPTQALVKGGSAMTRASGMSKSTQPAVANRGLKQNTQA